MVRQLETKAANKLKMDKEEQDALAYKKSMTENTK